jgi:hypothetical protein
MNSYRDEMKLCAPCSLMEVALQESEDQAAAALRRSLAVRKLIAGGMAAAPSKPVLFDQLAAYFDYDADSPSCTLGVILNLMLVQEGLRPSFCVQEADRNASNDFVYDRALSFAERHMAVVDIVGEGRRSSGGNEQQEQQEQQLQEQQGEVRGEEGGDAEQTPPGGGSSSSGSGSGGGGAAAAAVAAAKPWGRLICKPEAKERLAAALRAGRNEGKPDTAVGVALGYPAAAELRELHATARSRFSVAVSVEQSDGGAYYAGAGPSSLFAMVCAEQNKMLQIMDQAEKLRDFASSVDRDLRIRLNVYMYDEADNRPASFRLSSGGD